MALSHLQINSFYSGDSWEFMNNGEITYGVCFVEPINGVYDRSQRQIRYNFKVYLYDLVGVSENTEGVEDEVISDMMQVGADYLAMLGSPQWGDWEIENTAAFTSFTEKFEDMCAGVEIDLVVKVDWLPDQCQVPRDSITTEDGFDILTETKDIIRQE